MVRGSELLHTTIAPTSQRDAPYQVSSLQTPVTLSSAQTPLTPTEVSSSGSLSSPRRLPSVSLQPAVQVSFMATLTSPALLPQSHKRLRTIGGKNNVNPDSNMSNSVITSSSRGRGRGRSSRVRGNQKPSKSVDDSQWGTIYNFVNTNVTAHPDFETSRLARSINENLQLLEFFQKTFHRKIIQHIAAETNRYYAQSQQNIKNKYTKWVDVTEAELLAFFGVTLAMGLTNLPEMRDYWLASSFESVPWFRSIFTRGRIEQILTFLQLVNKENTPPRKSPEDKLYKLGSLPETLSKTYQECFTPERELAIDEQMVGMKCRTSIIQYMPKKPKKFGIKLWVLCESISGYCLNLQIYKGKEGDNQESDLPYRVVMDLMRVYLDRNHYLFVDNYYTFAKLFPNLEKQNTFACGTIRSNRGQLPDEFKNAKLSRDESIYINSPLNNGSLLAVHWYDKRDVFVLSTIHGTGCVEVRRRGDDTPFPKPTMIDECNHYMSGVDELDQLISTYSFTKKSKKWWEKVFFRLLEISVINACILYTKFHPRFASNNRKHKYFRIF